MFATIQLLLGLGLGHEGSALAADLALTAVAAVAGAVIVVRARRAQPPVTATVDPAADVVAEAESVTTAARVHEPV